jgi:YidC/Oxa1 family membrane protein insertase
MRELGQSVLGVFSAILEYIHDLVEPVFGVHSWGWAIIGLTLLVRILLLPLAIKQTRSMKAMQQLQPQMKAIQDKYKTDREMMRKDPEKYRARKQKQQQEMMALYQREGANPAASCLPLLAQAPIFLALFWTLRDEAELLGAPFYFITEATAGGLEKLVSSAGWPGWILILLMSGTMFFSQKQMMARNAASMADNPMAQQQKILLYVMPVFLAAISFQFPLGILLYWVTTNVWQIAQQAIILRESTRIDAANGKGGKGGATTGTGAADPVGPTDRRPSSAGGSRGATSGRRPGSASSGRPPTSEPEAGPDGDDPAEGRTPPSELEENSKSSRPVDGGTGAGTPGDTSGEATSDPSPGPRRRLPRRGGSR